MYENRCLYCDAIIPEGRQLCPKCEEERAVELIKTKSENSIIKNRRKICPDTKKRRKFTHSLA
jgi:RNA polymerase subunit RPABC4/transcription elongation factor Spt4